MGHCNKIAVPHDTCQCHFENSEQILFSLSNIFISTEVRYGTMNKAQEKKLNVEEMRLLRWMCGVTKQDRVRN